MFSPCRRLALALFLAAPVPAAVSALPAKTAPAPRITSVVLSQPVMHRNQRNRWSVTTTADVTRVEALVEGHVVSLTREGPGRFAVEFTVPWYVPFWYNHAWNLRFTAHTPSGGEADKTVTIQLK